MLDISNLSKSFGDAPILSSFRYHFRAETTYVLMGANGSGKTTLFNLIGGFMPCDSGEILLEGRRLAGLSPYKIAGLGVARTFQDLRLLYDLTVEENLLVALRNKRDENLCYALTARAPNDAYRESVVSMLRRIHLIEERKQKAANISYGQQKLLTLGMALINDFKILLLDEPVAGVQPHYREEIVGLLADIKKTIIIIEHDPDFIGKVSKNVLFLNEGAILAEGDYQTLRKNRRIQQAYL
uniref:Amino acid/amide ABC transporter ATP-binding protein 1, HAAT family n=1 Tax=Candidatus Kentrum sp. MB TaxID=2138164 RepID=A0A450XZW7_9GAMM|nr:MAG: amino acid/amide ABC transporter ATP-binding protein 1, HAAT family [Candidatus Kentron sp. MB]VFK34828.1 MAG: amino acid/amide ABC transporter ATP-binding protein 1, HAAT family [Candidatus Kentron sp. MB]VFK76968.1 MAG: amino acid/amide ABC transporter ATP-binding protein 1, HAAT family [Candidatus Kentron sp. MB]